MEVVQLPSKLRAILYYSLGVLNVVFLSAQATQLGDGTDAAKWIDFGQQTTAGASAFLFGIAAANVVSNKMVASRRLGNQGQNID